MANKDYLEYSKLNFLKKYVFWFKIGMNNILLMLKANRKSNRVATFRIVNNFYRET